MTYYLLILLLVPALAYAGRTSQQQDFRRLGICAVAIILALFAGLRSDRVGTDTAAYVRFFENYDSLEKLLSLNIEFGFSFLILIFQQISAHYAVFLTGIALATVSFYVWGMKKFVNRYELALFLFIAFGYYTFMFNVARQALAMAICFWALKYVFERRLGQYLLAIGIAFAFHRTALAAIPIYFIASERFNIKQIGLVGLGLAASFGALSFITEAAVITFGDRYSYYETTVERGGVVTTAFLVVQAIIFILIRRVLSRNHDFFTRCLNIYLVSIIPSLLTVALSLPPSGIMRLHFYFSISSIILWPVALASINDRGLKAMISIGLFVISMVYFVLTTEAFRNLIPYRSSVGVV